MLDIEFTQRNFEVFLLVLVRITSFVYIAPFFSQAGFVQRTKLGFSLCLSYLIYLLIPDKSLDYSTTMGYAELILKESATGLLLGFSAYICSTIILFAGRIIDMDIGLSMSNLFDPTTKEQASLTGMFYRQIYMVLFIITGMHRFLVHAITDSYVAVPIGQININPFLYSKFIEFLSDYFLIGFRIVLPIFAVTLIMNVVLGIMTKIAPQIHMFSVGIQIKIIAGFFIIMMTIILLPNITSFLNDSMRDMVKVVMKGLS